jgi:hypothetical protein
LIVRAAAATPCILSLRSAVAAASPAREELVSREDERPGTHVRRRSLQENVRLEVARDDSPASALLPFPVALEHFRGDEALVPVRAAPAVFLARVADFPAPAQAQSDAELTLTAHRRVALQELQRSLVSGAVGWMVQRSARSRLVGAVRMEGERVLGSWLRRPGGSSPPAEAWFAPSPLRLEHWSSLVVPALRALPLARL